MAITTMDTENNFDFVSIYDGGSDAATQLSHISGTDGGPPVTGAQSTAYVTFTSDGSVARGGFDMVYSCGAGAIPGAGGAAGCTTVRVDSRPMQGTVSGGNPSTFCLTDTAGTTYELTVDLLTLSDSVMEILDPSGTQIERNDDDGGSLASHLIWTAPASATYTISVDDFSGARGRGGDFTLEVTSMGMSDPCNGGLDLTDDSDTISFDDTAMIGATCDWVIRCDHGNGITFTFQSLNVESNFDFVSIYDSSSSAGTQLLHASGTTPPVVTTTTGRQMVRHAQTRRY
jgi:hypothetical protein